MANSFNYTSGTSKPSWEGTNLLAKIRSGSDDMRTAPNEMGDWMMSYVSTELKKIFGKDSSMIYLVGAVFLIMWMLLTILLLFRVSGKFTSSNATMNKILNSGVVSMLRSIPLSMHFIILLVLGTSLSLISEGLAVFSVGFLGAVILYYALSTFKTCKQIFLILAGALLLAYSLIQSKMLDSLVAINSGMISSVLAFSTIVATIFILLNHFIYRQKATCSLGAEGNVKDYFEI